ncbi:MAG TPA: hypothetical protein VGR53_10475 [Nitrososphaerales archaeon]|nr:hypothetical protein [Nitrososphaerales archaeon]
MNLFGGDKAVDPGPNKNQGPDEVTSRLDTALTTIFNEDGKRTVLYYMTNKFNLSLQQASADPNKLEKALTNLLGEVGWMVVKRAILEEFLDRKIAVHETDLVQRASLREAFGFIRGLGLPSLFKPL